MSVIARLGLGVTDVPVDYYDVDMIEFSAQIDTCATSCVSDTLSDGTKKVECIGKPDAHKVGSITHYSVRIAVDPTGATPPQAAH